MSTERPQSLPAGFEDLEVFVAMWALPREIDRIRTRWTGPMDELRRFYDAMLPRLDAIIEHLNKLDLKRLSEPDRRLLHLSLSLAEIADAVEVYGAPEVPYSFDPFRYPPTQLNDE
jgi:hypothetical protein